MLILYRFPRWFLINIQKKKNGLHRFSAPTQLLSNHAVSEFEHGGRVEQAVATISHNLKWIKWVNVHTAINVPGHLFLTGLQKGMEVPKGLHATQNTELVVGLDVNSSNNVVKIIQLASSHQKMSNIRAGNTVCPLGKSVNTQHQCCKHWVHLSSSQPVVSQPLDPRCWGGDRSLISHCFSILSPVCPCPLSCGRTPSQEKHYTELD